MRAKLSFLDRIGRVSFVVACIVLTAVAVVRLVTLLSGTVEGAAEGFEGVRVPTSSPIVDPTTLTAVVVVDSRCRFCVDSTPFYRRLQAKSAEGSFRLAFSATEPPDTTISFLRDHGLAEAPLVTLPAEVRLRVTPTILLVDRSGSVLTAYEGRLSNRQEHQLTTLIAARRRR